MLILKSLKIMRAADGGLCSCEFNNRYLLYNLMYTFLVRLIENPTGSTSTHCPSVFLSVNIFSTASCKLSSFVISFYHPLTVPGRRDIWQDVGELISRFYMVSQWEQSYWVGERGQKPVCFSVDEWWRAGGSLWSSDLWSLTTSPVHSYRDLYQSDRKTRQ